MRKKLNITKTVAQATPLFNNMESCNADTLQDVLPYIQDIGIECVIGHEYHHGQTPIANEPRANVIQFTPHTFKLRGGSTSVKIDSRTKFIECPFIDPGINSPHLYGRMVLYNSGRYLARVSKLDDWPENDEYIASLMNHCGTLTSDAHHRFATDIHDAGYENRIESVSFYPDENDPEITGLLDLSIYADLIFWCDSPAHAAIIVIGWYNAYANYLRLCNLTHRWLNITGTRCVTFICKVIKAYQTHKNLSPQPHNPHLTHFPSQLYIGADIEFLVTTTDDHNTVIPANIIIHDNQHTKKLGCDGHAIVGEIRPSPACVTPDSPLSVPKFLAKEIRQQLKKLSVVVPDSLRVQSGTGMSYEEPLGGHIHFNIPPLPPFVEMLDDFLGQPVYSVVGPRGRYGELGDVRQNNHGFEYRTLPSFLITPQLTHAVFSIATCLLQTFCWHVEQKIDIEYNTPVEEEDYFHLKNADLFKENILYFIQFCKDHLKTHEQQDIMESWKIRQRDKLRILFPDPYVFDSFATKRILECIKHIKLAVRPLIHKLPEQKFIYIKPSKRTAYFSRYVRDHTIKTSPPIFPLTPHFLSQQPYHPVNVVLSTESWYPRFDSPRVIGIIAIEKPSPPERTWTALESSVISHLLTCLRYETQN